jgi:DNA-directed RNA polymerase subunit N (RpoN/RPB10)
MEKEIEKFERILSKIRFSHNEGEIPQRTPDCIAEEKLEDYYQGTLSKVERTEIDKHLGTCRFCCDRLFIFDDLSVSEQVEIPQRLIAESKQMVLGSSPRILEIVLAATQKVIRIIKNTGELLSPVPTLQPVRGQENKANQDQLYDFVTISNEFEGLKMDVQIECINDSYKVILNASDPVNRLPLTGSRLALFSEGRELSSVEESEAIFYLKLRKYLIKILFENKELGEIRLDLRRAT